MGLAGNLGNESRLQGGEFQDVSAKSSVRSYCLLNETGRVENETALISSINPQKAE